MTRRNGNVLRFLDPFLVRLFGFILGQALKLVTLLPRCLNGPTRAIIRSRAQLSLLPQLWVSSKNRLLHLQRISSKISLFGRTAVASSARASGFAESHPSPVSAPRWRRFHSRHPGSNGLCSAKMAISRIDRSIRTSARRTAATIGPSHILYLPALSRRAAGQVTTGQICASETSINMGRRREC